MINTGQFDGLEDEVNQGVESIQSVLRCYLSSEAGKGCKAEFSAEFYKFFGDLYSMMEQIGGESSLLLRAHLMSRVSLDLNILSLAIYRSFRRILYCKCFNGIDLAQMKLAGLYAYWIAKMRPIVISKKPDDIDELSNELELALQEINERFAFYIVRSFYIIEFGKGVSDASDYQKHFVHAIKFRSFTEDSMMLTTQSLGVASDSTNTIF